MTNKWEGNYAPSHAHFFPKSPDQNFEIGILFRIVEKFIKYLFDDDLIPHSPRRKGCKLRTLPIVYI